MGIFTNYCVGASQCILPARHVDSLLFNVPQNANSDIAVRAALKMIQYANTELIMLDSGGYQLLQKEIDGACATYDASSPILYGKDRVNLAPPHVIDAAKKLKPKIVTSLDQPVPKVSDPYQQYAEFMKKLGPNLVWMRETAELRQKYCPEIELFIPIQCYELDQFENYVEKPLLELSFDGLSLPTRNLGPGGITLFLIKFYQMGVRKVHLLSVANLTGLALAAYFARNILDWCSVDATTWRYDADRQLYMDPLDFHQIFVGKGAVFQEGERPSCDCPWCGGLTFTGIKNMPITDRTSLLRCHNFYIIQEAGKEFYDNSGDLITLERCLRRRSKSRKIAPLIQALQIATHLREADIRVLERLLWKL